MPKFNIKEDLIYVECGNKLDYAACWLPEQDGDLVFLGWIRKFCYKYGRKMKVSADELGLTYKGWKAKQAKLAQEMAPKEEEEDKDLDEYIYHQNISWNDEATAI